MELTNTQLHPAPYNDLTKKTSFPVIKEEAFTYKDIPNATKVMYFRLVTQLSEKPLTFVNTESRDLTFTFGNKKTLVINKIARDTPMIESILWDFDRRNLRIQEFYRHYYGIQVSDKLSAEEQESLVIANLSTNTKLTKFTLPVSMQFNVQELYLVEDVGYLKEEDHIVAFMRDTSYNGTVTAENNDVTMIFVVRNNKTLTRELLHSIRSV